MYFSFKLCNYLFWLRRSTKLGLVRQLGLGLGHGCLFSCERKWAKNMESEKNKQTIKQNVKKYI